MELLIKIPKEFEQHFKQDAFEDSLHRLSADAHLIAGLYEQETAKMLRDAFKNAIPVPPHGRLGDLDALLMRINHEVMEAYMDGACYGVHPSQEYLYLLGEIIDDAPTIIPADPTEEEKN